MNEELIEMITEDEIDIGIEESIGWANGGGTNHNDLPGREWPDQHPIKSVIGLKAQLDEIKALKETVYANKAGVANYYKYQGDKPAAGHFVSMADPTSVKICDGSNIFGVVVDEAAFVGGQSEVVAGEDEYGLAKRLYATDDTYVLVATTGLVSVRCVSDVEIGDYVVSNDKGEAIKDDSESVSGYKVVAVNTVGDLVYVFIALGVQADITNLLDHKVQNLDDRLTAAEQDIIAVGNMANDAFEKSQKTEESNRDTVNKVDKNTEEVNGKVDDLENRVNNAEKAIDNVIISSEENFEQSMQRANDAWSKAENLKSDEYSIRANIDEYSIGEYSQAFGLTLEQATGILKSGMKYAPTVDVHTEIYPYSNQVTYENEWSEEGKDPSKVYCVKGDDVETYYYFDKGDDGEKWHSKNTMPTYTREFKKFYLYMWAELFNGRYGWITIDKDFNLSDDRNDSTQSVRFSTQEPIIAQNESWGYWYTNVLINEDGSYDKITDKDGNDSDYAPLTLYKLDKKTDEDGNEIKFWNAVATLKDNVNNRIMGITNLTSNNVSFEVFNARGSAASLGARISDTESNLSLVTKWVKGNDEDGTITSYNLAAIESKADAGGSTLTLMVADQDENKTVNGASIVLNQNAEGSYLCLDADQIVFTGESIFTKTDENGNSVTKINGSAIETGSLQSVDYADTEDSSVYSLKGMSIDLNSGCIKTPNFAVDENGAAYFNGEVKAVTGGTVGGFEIGKTSLFNQKEQYNDNQDGVYVGTDGIGLGAGKFYVTKDGSVCAKDGLIGGWNIDGNNICASNSGIYSGDYICMSNTASPPRFYAGKQDNSVVDIITKTHQIIQTLEHAPSGSFGVYTIQNASKIDSAQISSHYVGVVGVSRAQIDSIDGNKISYSFEGDVPGDILISFDCTYMECWGNNTKFIVLEDGSMYASQAVIEGNITATEGSLGKFKISDNSISTSSDNGLSFTADGLIVANKLQLSNHLQAEKLMVKDISGRAANSPCLSFEDTSAATGEVKINASFEVVEEGVNNLIAGNEKPGRVCVTITSEKPLSMERVFTITANYKTKYDNHQASLKEAVVMEMNKQTASIDFKHLYVWKSIENDANGSYTHYRSGWLDSVEVTPNVVLQPTDSTSQVISSSSHFIPNGDDLYLGTMDHVWGKLYVKDAFIKEGHLGDTYSDTGEVITSDFNQKNTIQNIDAKYSTLFDQLKPVTFKLNHGTSGRTHIGLIAQDVKSSADSLGIDSQDIAAYCSWKDDDGNETCGIRYGEFIALNIAEIQKLKARVSELENKINELEAKQQNNTK